MNTSLSRIALVTATIVAAVGTSGTAFAAYRYRSDADGTLWSDQGPRSTWHRLWRLVAVEELRNLAQPNPQALGLPEEIGVNYSELRRLMPHLARGNAELNWLAHEPLDEDPLYPDRPKTILSGAYRISRDRTFVEYRPAREGHSYLLQRGQEAYARAEMLDARLRAKLGRELKPSEVHRWQGPAFKLFRKAMSRPETVDSFSIVTAGNHHAWEWEALFEFWKSKGVIANSSGVNSHGEKVLPVIHSVTDPLALRFGRGSFAERKGFSLTQDVRELASRTRDYHEELSPNPAEAARGITRAGHVYIYAEEDPKMLAEARRELMNLSGEPNVRPRVKLVLLNALPPDEDSFDPLHPWEWTVFYERKQRPATKAEIELWTGDGCDDRLTEN